MQYWEEINKLITTISKWQAKDLEHSTEISKKQCFFVQWQQWKWRQSESGHIKHNYSEGST